MSADVPSRMRAAWYARCGPAHEVLQVGEVDTPSASDGEVLVKVSVSGVNPHDTKKRAGWLTRDLPTPRVVPHSDAAGTIVQVGPGVPEARIGERVWVFRADAARPGAGAAADYVVVASENAVRLPDHIGFEVGACLGVPALTAHRAVFADGPVTGKTILVTGAAGAVGSYAVQLARWGGARVFATVSTAEKANRALSLGAEVALDYRSIDVAAAILELTGSEGVDRVIEVDFGANLDTTKKAIKPNGVIAAYSSTRVREPVLPYYDLARKGVTLHFVQGLLLTRPMSDAGVRDLSVLLRNDRLVHPIGPIFDLDHIADAHVALEGGKVMGKVLVKTRG